MACDVDANEGVGRELAVGHIGRLHRLIDRRPNREMECEQKPARQTGRQQRAARNSIGNIFCNCHGALSYDWRPDAACLIAARMRT